MTKCVMCMELHLLPFSLLYSLYVGRIPLYMITDIELVKQILVKQFDHFTDRLPVSETCNCYYYSTITAWSSLISQTLWGGIGEAILDKRPPDLFFMPGEQWRQTRHIITPTFSSRNLKRVGS